MLKLSWYRAGMGIAVLVIAATAPRAQAASAAGAELQNRTTQAFDRYVRLTEARLSGAGPFLWIDGLPDARRRPALEAVRRKELSIERLETKDNGREIDVPGGIIHHWVGTAFVPSATSMTPSRCCRTTTRTSASTHRQSPHRNSSRATAIASSSFSASS